MEIDIDLEMETNGIWEMEKLKSMDFYLKDDIKYTFENYLH